MAIVQKKISEQDVKAANCQFYDAVAGRYEEIDGRRSLALEVWLRKNLSDLRKKVRGESLLDIGTGSGLVTRCADGIFNLRVGTDISQKILEANKDSSDFNVAADVDSLPFPDNSFDVVTCFSVLHHLYSFNKLVFEVRRVLKPCGIFYSDHDMDQAFNRRFQALLYLYRKFYDAGKKYSHMNKGITEELYKLTEWQENGIDSVYLASLFKQAGFSTELNFHWFGLAKITDRLFGKKPLKCGFAPLAALRAAVPDL